MHYLSDNSRGTVYVGMPMLILKYTGTTTALVAEVDCSGKDKDVCEDHGVTGFPRLLWGKACVRHFTLHPDGLHGLFKRVEGRPHAT